MKSNVPFDKISKKLTRDINLTDSAYRLIVLIINNQNDWKINTTYYQKLLGWSNDKLSNATKNLVNLGYIKRTKINKGNKGFNYQYEINLYAEQKESITETLSTEVIEDIQIEKKVTEKQEKVIENTSTDELIDKDTIKRILNNIPPRIFNLAQDNLTKVLSDNIIDDNFYKKEILNEIGIIKEHYKLRLKQV
jgi:predicted transcriptional regulator